MGEVDTWVFFAFMDGEDELNDERRVVTDWQVEDVIRWARFRGYDNIYLTRLNETTRFEKTPPVPGLVNHG